MPYWLTNSRNALTKLESAAGFQLKGSGWYQTDFRGSGGKPAAKAGAGKTESGAAESGTADAGKEDSGKNSATTEIAKSAEAKPSAPAAPAASTGGTPASGA